MMAEALRVKEIHSKIHNEVVNEIEEKVKNLINYFIKEKQLTYELKKELINSWNKVVVHRMLEESESGPYKLAENDPIKAKEVLKLKREHELLEVLINDIKNYESNDLLFVIKNVAALELLKLHVKFEEKVLF